MLLGNQNNTESKKHSTSLSTYVWKAKEEGRNPKVTFRAVAKAAAYTAATARCNLCLQERVNILMANEAETLNRRTEIVGKCRHRHKWTLAGWKPGVT